MGRREARRRGWLGRGAALASLLLLGCGAPAEPPRAILLITVDTLRADRLGAYGSTLGLTPNLDALASRSLVFERAYAAAPFTLPSVAALHTGRYPEELGLWSNESRVPDAVPTLASDLRERGWRTAAVVSNFVLRESCGLARGFDRYDDTFRQRESARRWPERIATDTTDAALAALRELDDGAGPWLLWVHYQDPHGPYTPPDGLRDRYLAAERDAPDGRRELPLRDDESGAGGIPRYQAIDGEREVAFYRAGYHAEIAFLDAQIGRLLETWSERGLDRRGALVFTADHGEGLGEDDFWFAHGERLSEFLVRVPLWLATPGLPRGRREDVVSLVDLHPTLLALAGETPARTRGRDLLAPDAEALASAPYVATLGAGEPPRWGLADERFLFVVVERDGVWQGRLTRLDGSGADLTAAAPQVAARMRRELRTLQGGLDRAAVESRQELTAEDRETLRALGYVE